jgi:hypothetical protein
MKNEDQLREVHGEHAQELQRQIREKEQILDGYKKEHGRLEVFFQRMESIISPTVALPPVYKPKIAKSGSSTTAVMQISDAHMGAVQVGDEIEGFNTFNPQICEQRQLNYAMRFMDWVQMHRTAYTINECAVIVTGDLISGDIHDELKITNAFPATEQVVKAAEVLTKQVGLIAPNFTKVTVHFIAEDNHARLTKKPQAKEAGINSLNYLVGKMASLYLASHKNVEFNIYPQFEKVIKVEQTQYLISHGHKIMGWMGIPWYSIERKVGKESMSRMQIIMQDINAAKEIGFHKYIFGHWHTPFNSALYACCGSVSGCDAYDHNAGRYSSPSQSAWMVHSKHKGREFDRIDFNL